MQVYPYEPVQIATENALKYNYTLLKKRTRYVASYPANDVSCPLDFDYIVGLIVGFQQLVVISLQVGFCGVCRCMRVS